MSTPTPFPSAPAGVPPLESSAAPLPARRLSRDVLLQYHSRSGRIRTVRTPVQWQQRRAEVLAGMQEIMGPLPTAKRVPPGVVVTDETDCGSYVRREITYVPEPGGRTPAFLLLPKPVLEGQAERSGVLALMGTNDEWGNRTVVGLGGPGLKPGRNYGEELVQRGHVVIAPAYPHLADYHPDLPGLGYRSGTMKAIWDNIRALDVLAAVPGVKRTGFGALGLSLGGHNSIFTAVFDERITAVVSSCGFDSFLDYYATRPEMWQPGQGWTQERYMPALAAFAHRRDEIPFDFHELIAALAPRPFLAIAPLRDPNFNAASVDRIVAAAAPVYALHAAGDRLRVEHPDCAHEFPSASRAQAYAWLSRFLS